MDGIVQLLNGIDTIILKLEEMRKSAYYKYGDWLLKHESKPYNVFSHFDKFATVSIELLLHYKMVWNDPNRRPSLHDMEERIKIVTGWCFMSILSAVEHFMKDCLRRMKDGPLLQWYDHRLEGMRKKRRGHISFGMILLESKEEGLISKADYENWTGTRLLRNALVHNNSIGDFTKEWNIDGTTVKFRDNLPIRYRIWAHSAIVVSISRLTYEWTQKFLEVHIVRTKE